MIILSQEQQKCVKYISGLYKMGQQIMTIAGCSGSGKSSSIFAIIKELDLTNKQVEFATFTGKASLVLRNKGIPAKTIHKLIYKCYKDKQGNFRFTKREHLDNIDCRLIVIDEISMVGQKMLDDLKSFNIPIICLGDPYQLAPVQDKPNNLLANPDYLLTEIFRQENGNTIIDLGEQLRKKVKIHCDINDEFIRPIDKNKLDISMLMWGDQILCSTHAVRRSLNAQIRAYKGFKSDLPQVGDKIICNKNYWNILSMVNDEPLVNGTIGIITFISEIRKDNFNCYMDVEFRPEWDMNDFYLIRLDLNPMCGFAPFVNQYNNPRIESRIDFDYGYAISIHKSQGSEWDKVVIYTPDAFGDKFKLLYTAVTRAREKILYIQ